MLELLWSLTSIEVIVTMVMFGVAIVLFIVTTIIAELLHSITRIAPNSKLAKWAGKHVDITITKD